MADLGTELDGMLKDIDSWLPLESAKGDTELRPETDLSKYTRQRLLQGLTLIRQLIEAGPTPFARRFFARANVTYRIALLNADPLERDILMVQRIDRDYLTYSFLFSPEAAQLYQKWRIMTDLRRWELVTLYGPGSALRKALEMCFGEIGLLPAKDSLVPRLRSRSATDIPPEWQHLADKVMTDTTYESEIQRTAIFMGFNVAHATWLYNCWLLGKHDLHESICSMIERCEWRALARRLQIDFDETLRAESDVDVACTIRETVSAVQARYLRPCDAHEAMNWCDSEFASCLTEVRERAS